LFIAQSKNVFGFFFSYFSLPTFERCLHLSALNAAMILAAKTELN